MLPCLALGRTRKRMWEANLAQNILTCLDQVGRHKERFVTSLVVFVTFSMLRVKNGIYSVEFNVPFLLEMYSHVKFLPARTQ